MNEELYQQNILDHYKNPRNKGVLEDLDLESKGSNPTCGDKIVLYIKLNEKYVVEKATFDGDGCAISVAAASMLTEYIEGKTIQDLKLITPGDIYGMLGVQIGPARVNCALLAYKALSDSLEKYEPNTK